MTRTVPASPANPCTRCDQHLSPGRQLPSVLCHQDIALLFGDALHALASASRSWLRLPDVPHGVGRTPWQGPTAPPTCKWVEQLPAPPVHLTAALPAWRWHQPPMRCQQLRRREEDRKKSDVQRERTVRVSAGCSHLQGACACGPWVWAAQQLGTIRADGVACSRIHWRWPHLHPPTRFPGASKHSEASRLTAALLA